MTLGKCSFEGCGRDNYAKQLCRIHYVRKLRGKKPVDRPVEAVARRSDLVEVPSVRVPEIVATALRDEAEAAGVSLYYMVARVLENWYTAAHPLKPIPKDPGYPPYPRK